MKQLFALTLVAAALFATVAPITTSAMEVSPVADVTVTIPEAAPLPVMEVPVRSIPVGTLKLMETCAAFRAVGAAGPCDDEESRVAIDILACLILNLPFFKALSVGKTVVAALLSGGGLVGLSSAIGTFFCMDAWNSFWEWKACMSDSTSADLSQDDWNSLAAALQEEIDELEANGPS